MVSTGTDGGEEILVCRKQKGQEEVAVVGYHCAPGSLDGARLKKIKPYSLERIKTELLPHAEDASPGLVVVYTLDMSYGKMHPLEEGEISRLVDLLNMEFSEHMFAAGDPQTIRRDLIRA